VAKPRIAITEGDPAGIGPEIARKAAADRRVLDVCEPVLYGAPSGERFAIGRLSAEAGKAAYDTIVAATTDAQAGTVDAVATAPINKEALRLAGYPWHGHTDLTHLDPRLELPRQLLDEFPEVDAAVGREIEDHLRAVERLLDARQLHRQCAFANFQKRHPIGVLLALLMAPARHDVVAGGQAHYALR
jgi:4-hydroxythreonine-4-phosphate dehydrogenase